MKDIYLKIIELIEKGRFSVLATIIRQAGPSPRGIGTKFLIMDDGSFIGTIGGGILEAQTLKEAENVFDSGLPFRLSFSLKGSDVADTDMLCGGNVEVFLELISPKNPNSLSIFHEVVKVTQKGGVGLIATVIDPDRWHHGEVPKMFVGRDGQQIGSLPGIQGFKDILLAKMDQILRSRQPVVLPIQDDRRNQVEFFVEPVVSNPALYVFGGGHVSKQIVPLASRVGFHVVVIDDRREFADTKNFPDAGEVHQFPFEGVMEKLPVDESSFLIIVTRGHMNDKIVLSQALRTKAMYIGMIGSSRKRKIIYEKLLEEGFTQGDLSKVSSPIGIDIGAETPEEIGVSIVAELIKVRAGCGRHLDKP